MADKDDKPDVEIEKVGVAKVWDERACKDLPKWAAAALKDGLGSSVNIISTKPETCFIHEAEVKPIRLDEDKAVLFGEMSVLVMDAKRFLKANVPAKASVTGVTADKIEKKLQTLVAAIATRCGQDARKELQD